MTVSFSFSIAALTGAFSSSETLSPISFSVFSVTDEFLAYALPLVQAELTPIYVEGLPHHIYLPEA